MNARDAAALRKLHLAFDLALLVGAMALAAWLQPLLRGHIPLLREAASFSEHALLVYLSVPLWLALIVALRLHQSFELLWSQGELLGKLIKLHVLGLVGLALIQFLTQSVINRSLVALFMASSFAGMYLQRLGLSLWLRYQHRRGQGQQRLLLVGHPGKRMGDFVRDALAQPLPPRLLGYLRAPSEGEQLSMPPPDMPSLACLGGLEEIGRVLHESAIDQVMFFPPANRPEHAVDALAACEELGVLANFSVSLTQLSRTAPRITSAYQHPFVTFEMAPKRPEWLALKHGLDPLLAAILIVLLSPLLLLTALAVLVTMGRPILFTQERAGLNGRSFRMLKFRSMVPGAEARRAELEAQNELNGPVFKIKADPRITPLGRILRKTSLDELPQLFNVLTGSMSLVGPRPLPLVEQGRIRGWQRRRLSMKPGITGLWQVSGRSGLDFDEWMLLDLKYVDEWSLTLDLILLLRTVPVVLFGRGAH